MLKKNEMLVLGFALFAMFFGAGNLIFPPSLGVSTGINWLPAGIGFLITGAGLPLLGVISFTKLANLDHYADKVSPWFNKVYCTALILAIGPLFAIPRTGSTTFELGVLPLVGGDGSTLVVSIVSSLIFFGLTYILTIKENSITDVIGKFLTPVILVIVALIFIRGMGMDLGTPVETNLTEGLFGYGFVNGYQTMDALASILFGVVIVKSLRLKGITEVKLQQQYLVGASVIASIGLGFIYFFLIFLGSKFSGSPSGSITNAALTLSQQTLGTLGSAIFGICVGAACLTTSVGLTALVSEWFSKLTSLSYRTVAVITCVFSAVIAVGGVNMIVTLAVPALLFLYPITIVLILLNIFGVQKAVYFQFGTYTTIAMAAIEVFGSTFNIAYFQLIVKSVPLGTAGFPWVLPFLLSLVIAFIIDKTTSKKETA